MTLSGFCCWGNSLLDPTLRTSQTNTTVNPGILKPRPVILFFIIFHLNVHVNSIRSKAVTYFLVGHG
jgi:hypothetical protein